MEIDCGYRTQAALLSMMAQRQGNLGAHMGRKWGKRRAESSLTLFCCLNLEDDRAEQGSAWSAIQHMGLLF